MKKLFDYPPTWKSESEHKAKKLVIEILNHANRLGIKINILNPGNPYVVGWDKVIRFDDAYIQLNNQDYGCTLYVVITNETKVERIFLQLWKDLIDEGLCKGGPYIKGLKNMTKMERQKVIKELAKKDLTLKQMAERAWCSPSTIQRDLNELGIKTPSKRKNELFVMLFGYSQKGK